MTLEEVCKDRFFANFYEISQIPRGSCHEEKISEYLVDWAKKRNLYVIQDEYKNVLMRKEASEGYEGADGVILQAHMDMVCEKNPESAHDFEKDAIPWLIEGDCITTGKETTLGADDGIGMALAMAVLEEEEWKHPMLEVLFTVKEEEDLSGAACFDTRLFKGSRLINLDHVNDHEILCGSCGGEAVEVELNLESREIKEAQAFYTVKVSGLKGGHSGEDIHRGHGNANRILARVLSELEKITELKLCSIKGGSFRLAIAREAECVAAFPKQDVQKVQERLHLLERILKEEYQSAGEQMKLEFALCREQYEQAYDIEKLLTLILLSPDGIWEMSSDIEHLVNTSDNLGEIHMEGGKIRVVYEIRSGCDSARDYIADVIGRLAKCLGGVCKVYASYPSWKYSPNSAFREIAAEVFEEVNGSRPRIYAVHAGLECGCFFAGKPDLDAISIGPDCWGLHSPEEKVSISSTKKMYKILKGILEKLHE